MNNSEITEPNPFTERLASAEVQAPETLPVPVKDNHKVPIPITAQGIELTSIEAVWRVATLLYRARLAPVSFKTPEQIAVALLRAIELKIPPLQAIEGMSVINGRVGLMGDLALSIVESSGLLEDKKVQYSGKDDELSCTITLTRKGRSPASYSFSVAQAKRAGLWGRPGPWTQYPDRMLRYRALGFGLRDEFPDVLKGIKTIEELQDYPAST